MKTKLANKLLRALLDFSDDDESELLPPLLTMAEVKWDSYEGFRAGQRFMESLARWLQGFDDQPTRRRWLEFVLKRLIFISAAEVDHLISVTYPDFIRPAVLERAAANSGIEIHRKAQLMNSPAFKIEQRRILVCALSDGAHLDALRRNSALSHEQFVPQLAVPGTRRAELHLKLDQAIAVHGGTPEQAIFNHVLLIDDFYGSGTSLIDVSEDEDGAVVIQGKIKKVLNEADLLTGPSDVDGAPVLTKDYSATIHLYMASRQAKDHIENCLVQAGLADRWTLNVVQVFDDDCKVDDPQLLADCDSFWDPILEDEHKKYSARGYRNCALAVVLYHNAPNNSLSPLWADSIGRRTEGSTSLERRALFPRYERHHSDRP